jgi:hypothetical protein
MTKYALLLLFAVSLGMAGCSEKTQEAVQEDTADATEAILTPKIKSAIIANPILNDPNNLIDVMTEGGTVYLRGHVVSEEAKAEATQIAQQVLDESESTFPLVNELEVKPAPVENDDGNDSSGNSP